VLAAHPPDADLAETRPISFLTSFPGLRTLTPYPPSFSVQATCKTLALSTGQIPSHSFGSPPTARFGVRHAYANEGVDYPGACCPDMS
jgi:hypothetical protein